MKISSKIFIIFALICVSAEVAYSQNCNGYLQQAKELLSQKKYCEAKLIYQEYSKCNPKADVSWEIAMCERSCKFQDGENMTLSTPEQNNPVLEYEQNSPALIHEQDIIVLKNGNEIQAIVQEIGIDDVKYKRFNNKNGPNYTLRKTDIFMIKYANGEEEIFTENIDPYKRPAPSRVTRQPNVQSQADNQYDPAINYVDFTFMRKNDAAMEAFLRQHDTDLYNTFLSGKKFKRIGRALLLPGIILTATGLPMAIVGAVNTNIGTDQADALFIAGLFGASVGESLIIASIPLFIVGGNFKKRAVNGYEDKYFNQRTSYQPSLNFGITKSGGLGLTLNF